MHGFCSGNAEASAGSWMSWSYFCPYTAQPIYFLQNVLCQNGNPNAINLYTVIYKMEHLVHNWSVNALVAMQTPMQAVAVHHTGVAMMMCSLYVYHQEWQYLQQTLMPSRAASKAPNAQGDFNVHNPMWGFAAWRTRGVVTAQWVAAHDLVLNIGLAPTSLATSIMSSIDTICTPRLWWEWSFPHYSSWWVGLPWAMHTMMEIASCLLGGVC